MRPGIEITPVPTGLHVPAANGPAPLRGLFSLRQGIGRRLLVFILLFSSFVTLLLTAIQLYLDYHRDVRSISERFVEIEQSYLNSIAGSLWDVDAEQLRTQLEGIRRLPDIQAVEVRETVGNVRNPLRVTVGEPQDRAVLSRQVPVIYQDRDKAREIGILYIEATLEEVYARLWEKGLVILASQGIKTFLVSFFILFVVHRLVTRHLVSLAGYAGRYDFFSDPDEYRLERKRPQRPDELDQVVSSFNAMCRNLNIAYKNLNAANQDLESRVEERTRDLVQEITEREAAEAALRFSEKRFRDIAETVTDLLWETDGDLCISLVSGHVHLIGLAPGEQMAGAPMANLLNSAHGFDPNPEWENAVVAWHMDRQPFRNEEFEFGRDGETSLVISVSGLPIRDKDGEFRGFRGSIRDITDRKRAEALVRESNELLEQRVRARTLELTSAMEEAEIANRSKTEFLNNMSHELRTPLNAVIGFSEMMQNEVLGPLENPQYKAYAGDIHASGKYLLDIINEILDVSRVETGQLTLELSDVASGDLVERCCTMMRDKADTAGVALDFEAPEGAPRMRIDERRFMQIVLNLLSNAIKFTPAGGTVAVSIRAQAEGAMLVVRDSGIGIPSDRQEEVFKPFARLGSSLIAKHEGVGLGLSIVKSLVEQHGASLSLSSLEGQGTEIRILFPADSIIG